VQSKPYKLDYPILSRETIMEGSDMKVNIVTCDVGQCIPWHFHSEITDSFVCLSGSMVVENRAPRKEYILQIGDRCEVPPKVAHYVHGLDDGAFKFLLAQGVGTYDNIPIG
jgi:quercetin dioxygenase-like cupin family protein